MGPSSHSLRLSYLSQFQHQCHLLLEASLISQPERVSIFQTSQASLHIMGIYVHILPTYPIKCHASGKQNLFYTVSSMHLKFIMHHTLGTK